MNRHGIERKYKARLTAVYRSGTLISDAQHAPQSHFTYSARAVDTEDVVEMVKVQPFRRWIAAVGGEEPDVICAMAGDDCEIARCQGQYRLTDVPEQYQAGPCEDPSFA